MSLRIGTARHLRNWRRRFLADKHPVANLLDSPAWNRIERKDFAALHDLQAEAGMMKWASDLIADNQPLSKRPPIVGAMSADGDELRAAAHQQHIFAASLSFNDAAIQA